VQWSRHFALPPLTKQIQSISVSLCRAF